MVKIFQHIGNRAKQEDAYYSDEIYGMYIVCDGMGGHEKGSFASQTVISSFVNFFDSVMTADIQSDTLTEAFKNAQSYLNRQSENRGIDARSGTTVALLIVRDDHAITAHVGDSRILLIKNGSGSTWTTKDHSLVQELYDANILKSEAEMYKHPMKNKITNALFTGQDTTEVEVTINELNNLSKGDRFILCTDGVFEAFSPQSLAQIVAENHIDEALKIIAAKVEKESRDNSTILLLEI